MKNFQDRLKTLSDGVTQKEFAKKINVPLNTFTAWLRGERLPSYEAIVSICSALGVTADWLLGLPENTTNTQSGAKNQPHPQLSVRQVIQEFITSSRQTSEKAEEFLEAMQKTAKTLEKML